MITVAEFALPLAHTQYIDMPRGANIIGVGLQFGDLRLYAEIDTDHTNVRREIRIVNTGQELRTMQESPRSLLHIGSVQLESAGRCYVWHVYEKITSALRGEAVHGS
jgi:hypothetical protein